MKRVLWVILGIAFASFLYAGPRVPTPTPNVQKIKGRGLGIAAHKEVAPTVTPGDERALGQLRSQGTLNKKIAPTLTATAEPQREVALSGPDTATKEKGKGKMPAYDKEAAPTVTPVTPGDAGAIKFGRDSLKGTTKEAAPTATPIAVDKTTVNTSKSNTFKEAAPTVTPTRVPKKK